MNAQPSLTQAIIDLNNELSKSIVKKMLEEGTSANEILLQCQQGMTEMGKQFEEGECFIPELIIAGRIMEDISNELEPVLKNEKQNTPSKCTVVIGTVQHDIHNIGKDIVTMILQGSGFNVIDLGVDVTPQAYVDAIQQHNAQIVGMSLLLTTGYPVVQATVEAIKNAGLRDQVSIMIGGAATTELLAEKTGCDFYGKTARDAVLYAESI